MFSLKSSAVVFLSCLIIIAVAHNWLLVSNKVKAMPIACEKITMMENYTAAFLFIVHVLFIISLFDFSYLLHGKDTLAVDKYGVVLSFYGTFLYILTDAQIFPAAPWVNAFGNKNSIFISDRILKMISLPLVGLGTLLQLVATN